MKEEFLNKLNNHKYISTLLFNNVKKEVKQIIPQNFNLEEYNNKILNQNYSRYKSYFDNMYNEIDPNIHLDEEQVKAILTDEDYSLILAGAGTGKTTTMASKVKYLVDIQGVDPSKILVMSYTKKATEELEKRIVIDFDIPTNVITFHSLGLMYVREIFKNRKCYVVDDNIKDKIFYNYFKTQIFPHKYKIKEILYCFDTDKSKEFILGKHFIDNYYKYRTYEEYFEAYKKKKLKEVIDLKSEIKNRIDYRINSENPTTIKNELVKSKGEALIANFLYCNSIDYHYEKIYKEVMSENRTYKPDFTLELGGDLVYIEYFGFSTYDKDNLNRYNKIKKMKEDYHKNHNTKFIKLDYDKEENLILRLKEELLNMGFKLTPKSDEEIFYSLLSKNPLAPIFKLKDFFYKTIELIKSSPNRKQYYNIVQKYIGTLNKEEQKIAQLQFKYINDFYLYYQNELFGVDNYGFDFSDMIYYANLYINKIGNNNNLNFEYLIIDEYQDISADRYEFAKNIANKNKAKIVAVGDDWQSIFAFAGSKIKYIYNFQKYFPGAKILRINKTYRNSQELINYTGNFIMKNQDQIKKDLISSKQINNPIKFVLFDELEEYETLKKLILKIHSKQPNHKIMVLARTNRMIEKCYDDIDLKDDIGTKIKFVGYNDLDIDGMTIHKSKGLTSDEVILIGLNEKFPSNHSTFWLDNLFRPNIKDESIPFAEERRLFYVALTRTKNNVYLLVNKNSKYRSPFVNEIYQTIKEVDNKLQYN
ncbi:MAG: UvrD-helicase domain-containing protein [Bacilli bacterium]|nr:UvrD-helicase domain-containing protein [Bacilli bacterium]